MLLVDVIAPVQVFLMTRPAVFYIQLTNPQPVYYPGDRVEGFLYLGLTDPIKARGLNLQFFVREHTEWMIQVRVDDHRRPGSVNGIHHRKHHDRREESRTRYETERIFQTYNHMDFTMPLLRDAAGKTEMILPQGNSQYFFSFSLPNYQLPPSVQLDYGKITYSLRAYLDLAWRPDFETHLNINVLPVPWYPSGFYLSPCKIAGDHTLGCCFKSGILYYTHQLNKNVFTCGETIVISGVLDNLSSVKILGLSAHVSMRITYYANGNTKVDCQSLYGVNYPPTVESYVMELETSSGMIPTTFNSCQLIEVSYDVVITVKTKGCHRNIVKSFPIIIIPAVSQAMTNQMALVDKHMPRIIQVGEHLIIDYETFQAKAAKLDNPPQYKEKELISNNL